MRRIDDNQTTISRNAKIGIGVVAAVVFVCLCLCVCAVAGFALFGGALADRVMETDPDQARRTGAAMLDYELPEGYHELAAMDIFTVKMVMIGRSATLDELQDSQYPMIIIGQVASRELMDDPQVRQQVERSIEQSFRNSVRSENVEWGLVDSSPVTIAGQEVSVDTYEGQGQDGVELRQQITGVFEGKGGATFLMVMGPTENWPKDEIEAFYASIK